MASFFRRLGEKTGAAARKGRWLWQTLVGSVGDEIRAEENVGLDLAREVERERDTSRDARGARLVEGIATALAEHVADRRRRFRVRLLADASPNAFALPGGYLYVHEGLLELCDRDRDETAFVIAHEMGHVVRRHAIDRIIQSTAISALTSATRSTGVLSHWIRRVGTGFLERAYTREQELDADAFATRLCAAAGFDAEAGERLLARLPADDLPEYFSTHPRTADRAAAIRRTLRDRAREASP